MRITVTREKLAAALLVWLRVAPKAVWRKFEAYERLMAAKRHKAEDDPKPREELAQYLAEKFEQSDWEVSHPEPRRPG